MISACLGSVLIQHQILFTKVPFLALCSVPSKCHSLSNSTGCVLIAQNPFVLLPRIAFRNKNNEPLWSAQATSHYALVTVTHSVWCPQRPGGGAAMGGRPEAQSPCLCFGQDSCTGYHPSWESWAATSVFVASCLVALMWSGAIPRQP